MRRIVLAIAAVCIAASLTAHAAAQQPNPPPSPNVPDLNALDQRLKDLQPQIDAAVQRAVEVLQMRLPEIRRQIEQQIKQLDLDAQIQKQLEQVRPQIEQQLEKAQEDLERARKELEKTLPR